MLKFPAAAFCLALPPALPQAFSLPGKGDDTPASSASTSPEAPASSVSELEPIGLFTVEDFPKLDGSTACIPLMAQMMADTTGIDLEVAQSGISVSTTAYAWENFGLYPDEEYTARMLVVYEAPDYVKEELKEANAQLEQKPIGRDALVFIVNENNPVKSLTRQQLKDIYAGKITNWKEVGGEDLAIVPFQRGEDSGSQTLFRKLLIQGGELMDPPTELAPAAMGELVDSIAAFNNSANAIGFSVYYYIDQMYSQPGLRLLAVDGVTPSNDTIASESYPLCNEFYAVLHADAAADSPERQLYDWLDTAAGQDCIKKIRLCSGGPHHCSEQCRLIFQQLTAFCISVTILHMNVETFFAKEGSIWTIPPPMWKAAGAPSCATASFRRPVCWKFCCPALCSSACCSALCRSSSGCPACCLTATKWRSAFFWSGALTS